MDNSSSQPLHAFLIKHPGVEFIRMQWADLSGVLRTHFIPKHFALQLASEGKYICTAVTGMLFPVSPLNIASTPPTGSIELRPDWSSLRLCGFAPKHGSVMCATCMPTAYNPFKLCPRTLLASLLSQCEKKQGLKFLMGFEVEFVLLDTSLNLHPPPSLSSISGWSMSVLDGDTLESLEEITRILEEANILVQGVHTEGPFQLEIATGPMSPMEAIDALMYTHETIRAVFARRSIRATMSPNASYSAPKSGAHTHISLNRPELEESFLAGMLAHLRSISTFGMPSYDSYSRVKDFLNGAGTWVSWGCQHRDVPIRKIEKAHWEIRCVDATANFYMVAYLLLAAGLEGVEKDMRLEMKGLDDYPTNIGVVKLGELGVVTPFPESLAEACDLLRSDSSIERLLGAETKEFFLSVKQVDIEGMKNMFADERMVLFAKTF
jgi:glutamine synthetase